MDELILTVTDFVAFLNQTLETAYPSVTIQGELAHFRVSKNRWVYFDLKDEFSSVKFFGTVYQLPGPLEDGLILQVRGVPRLHPQYGFSVTVQAMQPVGEGSIKRAATLLQAKLAAEGLFDDSRKRVVPYPPQRIGLITSRESAAYADFIKIINARWGGLEIELRDVHVQGEAAAGEVVTAIELFNQAAQIPDVLVITRGGGSAEDLAAFSTEQVTRAVAASRIPTVVAIGHEIDMSLAELAADRRASTPSNAAELLVPDKRAELAELVHKQSMLHNALTQNIQLKRQFLTEVVRQLSDSVARLLHDQTRRLGEQKRTLELLNPYTILKRGYAILQTVDEDKPIKSVTSLSPGDRVRIVLHDGRAEADITTTEV